MSIRKIFHLLILGLYLSSCTKKGSDPGTAPPDDTTTPPVVIVDQPDDGKDTIGNWQLVHHRDLNTMAAWTQLLFPTPDTGYLVNTAWLPTSAYATSFDGGKTWSNEYFMVTNNEFLDMIDGTTGIGYRRSSGTTLGSDIDAIVWSPSEIRYSRLVYNGSGFGHLRTTGISIPSREYAYVTLDDGESVRLKNPFNYSSYVFNPAGTVPQKTTDINFVDNVTGWLCTSDGEIMATKDSSKNWTSQLSVSNTGFSKIYFIDGSTGWASSYTNSFYKTTDGGATWIKIAAPGITSKSIDFVFTTKTRGFFIAGRDVFETSDGGAHWIRSCKMGTESFQSITRQGANVFVLSEGSETRTTPLTGGGTETSSWTHATILKYQ